MFTIGIWVAFSAWNNPSQFGDNIEQFNWSHSMEWGYWKHPPLSTFLLACIIALFGNWVYWAYCLSALSFMGTAFFTWKIASKLLGEHAGAVTVILLGLHLGFSWRAQIYNHNTVLLLVISAMVWNTLLAVNSKSLSRWVITGVLAGLAMLTKYQAIVPILGIIFTLYRSSALKDKGNLRGFGFSILVAFLIFLPHCIWLWTNHFPTLHYAKHSAQHLDTLARAKKIWRFLTYQIRCYLPIFITLGFVLGYVRYYKCVVKPIEVSVMTRQISDWMWGLVGVPLVFLMLMVLIGGVRLESHWGLQTFQFACLWLVWRLQASIDGIRLRYFLIPAVVVHSISIGWYYQSNTAKLAQVAYKTRRIDRIYPAKALAEHALLDWQKVTNCPLMYVVGPPFEAGLIALYSGSYAAVQEVVDIGDPMSPWIKPSDVAEHGAIQVWTRPDKAPTGVVAEGMMAMPKLDEKQGSQQKVYWHIALPQQPCV